MRAAAALARVQRRGQPASAILRQGWPSGASPGTSRTWRRGWPPAPQSGVRRIECRAQAHADGRSSLKQRLQSIGAMLGTRCSTRARQCGRQRAEAASLSRALRPDVDPPPLSTRPTGRRLEACSLRKSIDQGGTRRAEITAPRLGHQAEGVPDCRAPSRWPSPIAARQTSCAGGSVRGETACQPRRSIDPYRAYSARGVRERWSDVPAHGTGLQISPVAAGISVPTPRSAGLEIRLGMGHPPILVDVRSLLMVAAVFFGLTKKCTPSCK